MNASKPAKSPPRAAKRPGGVYLVLNAGSSSLKFAVFESAAGVDLSAVASGQVARLDGTAQFSASMAGMPDALEPIAASEGKSPSAHRQALDAILGWLDRHGIEALVTVSFTAAHVSPTLSSQRTAK
jgi:acetate kinase